MDDLGRTSVVRLWAPCTSPLSIERALAKLAPLITRRAADGSILWDQAEVGRADPRVQILCAVYAQPFLVRRACQ